MQTNDFYDAWPVYKRLAQAHLVPIRVFFTLPFDEWENANAINSGAFSGGDSSSDAGSTSSGSVGIGGLAACCDEVDVPLPDDECGLVSCHRVKLFADGSLGMCAWTAIVGLSPRLLGIDH